MNAYRKIKILLLLLPVMFLSCESFLDVNSNPDAVKTSDEKLLLPYGMGSLAYIMGGRYQVLGSLWSQHWTQSLGASQYKGLDSYDINSSTYNGEFSELYAGALMNFEEVRKMSAGNGNWNYYLMATVLQAYTFQVLADLYEYIPFSEAFKGIEGELTPAYEYSQNIYDSLIARIDFALEQDYDNDELEEIGEEDMLFGGDIERWVEFANTLKLKVFIRQSEARPEVAQAGIEELYKDKKKINLLENEVLFYSFEDASGKRNPLYETDIVFFGYNPNLVISNTLLGFLERNGDFDRLDAMFNTPEIGGPHKGLDQGNFNDPDEPSGTNSSTYSKPVFDPVYPVFLFSLSEIYFMEAEAMVRFGVDDYDAAKEKYEMGIEAAFYRYGFENAKDFYAAGAPYEFPSEGVDVEEYIKAIAMQKWVALVNFQSLEAFFEHNRTRYPIETNKNWDNLENDTTKFTVSVNNVTSGRFPRRLIYPESEYSTNAENVPEQQPVYEKMWWHKQ